MLPQAIKLGEEVEVFASPFVDKGLYPSTAVVLHAAMDAFRLSRASEKAINDALLELAEEGEASGEAESDIFARVREKYGLKSSLTPDAHVPFLVDC